MAVKITRDIAGQAAAVVQDRMAEYGSPKKNFNRIAQLQSGWLDARYGETVIPYLDNLDIMALNILTKLARIIESPDHVDSYIDIAGYADAGYHAVND